MLHFVFIVFFSSLQAMVTTMDQMFSQSQGLQIGRKHRNISGVIWVDQLAFTTMQEIVVKIPEINKQSVAYALVCHEEKSHIEYEIRLRAVVGVVIFLLEQGLVFVGMTSLALPSTRAISVSCWIGMVQDARM
jgi:hypothetical protein